MKQKLEEFIYTNREDFDNDVPANRVWEKIQRNSIKKNNRVHTLFSLRNIAAAIATIALGITIYLAVENNRLKQDLTASMQKKEQQKAQQDNANTNYDQEINQFTQIVAVKQTKLSTIKHEYPKLYNTFITDINELNKEYKSLKTELNNVPEQEIILDAMIQNLRLQAELLNEQLLIIQQLKNSKKHKNEKRTPVI
jgi:hypothetical protein